MSEQTIPVQIDSIKRTGEFQKTRCAYFRIEITDGPIAEPHPILYNEKVRLAVWGSWAALMGPDKSIDDHDLFISPESINRTLVSIEETEGLFLDLGYIWLPNKLLALQDRDSEVRNGDVYRLPMQLFHQCYRFIADMITEDEWLDSCESYSNTILSSSQETFAFRQWRKKQIKRSSDRYHQSNYADHRLPKKRTKK